MPVALKLGLQALKTYLLGAKRSCAVFLSVLQTSVCCSPGNCAAVGVALKTKHIFKCLMDLGLILSPFIWAFLLCTAQSNACSFNMAENNLSRHQKGHNAKEQPLENPSALTQ